MNLKDIALARLNAQQISNHKFKKVKDVVNWMGAIQAQDNAMAKWAIGLRLPSSTDNIIQAAIDKGEIIRTHVLRPTWHFISADDVYWLLELTAPQIKTAMRTHDKELGLTDAIYKKSNTILEKILQKNKHLTRDELIIELEKAKIKTNDYRSGHLLMRAELEGIICSGAIKNNKQTYAFLPDRVKKTKHIDKEEALARLAKKYFLSHGPATLNDFKWWSGLALKDARTALEIIKKELASGKILNEDYWFDPALSFQKKNKSVFYLLPAFDEYIISYKDRTASITQEKQLKTFTKNGLFKPVIINNGIVTGTWKRNIVKDHLILEQDLFETHSPGSKKLIQKSAALFAAYTGKKLKIV